MSDAWFHQAVLQLAQDDLTKAKARIAELEAAIDRMYKSQGRSAFSESRAALMSVRNKTLHK